MHNFNDILIFIFAIWMICKTASRACSMVQPCKSTASNQRILPAFKSSKPYVEESQCDSLTLLGLRPDLKQLVYLIARHVRYHDHLRQLHVSPEFVHQLFGTWVFTSAILLLLMGLTPATACLNRCVSSNSSDSA